MGARADTRISALGSATQFTGCGSNYIVKTPAGVLYAFTAGRSSNALDWTKSTDGGLTWTPRTQVASGSIVNSAAAIWYDRWSGIAGDLIHIAIQDDTTDDVLYRNLDTTSDTLSTQTTIFAGASTAAGGALSIVRARGGNLCCGGTIDAGTETFFSRSTDVGANWGARTDSLNEAATTDQFLLAPDWNADNQDICAFFWDASAGQISIKRYDDSANSWAETILASSMTLNSATVAYPHFAFAVDFVNSRNVMVCWSNVDTANADLRCFHCTSAVETEVTNVVLNSVDDQGLCAISISEQTGYWWVTYAGKSDGSETWQTSLNLYCKVSTDAGSTWGTETKLSATTRSMHSLCGIPATVAEPLPWASTWNATGAAEFFCNVDVPARRAGLVLGMG